MSEYHYTRRVSNYSFTILHRNAPTQFVGGSFETAAWLNRRIYDVLQDLAKQINDGSVEVVILAIGKDITIYQGDDLIGLARNGKL